MASSPKHAQKPRGAPPLLDRPLSKSTQTKTFPKEIDQLRGATKDVGYHIRQSEPRVDCSECSPFIRELILLRRQIGEYTEGGKSIQSRHFPHVGLSRCTPEDPNTQQNVKESCEARHPKHPLEKTPKADFERPESESERLQAFANSTGQLAPRLMSCSTCGSSPRIETMLHRHNIQDPEGESLAPSEHSVHAILNHCIAVPSPEEPNTPETPFVEDAAQNSKGESCGAHDPKHPCEKTPKADLESLKSERERLQTFAGWPHPFVDREELAGAGFYFLGRDDKVQCVFCRGIVGRWTEGDRPLSEHARHFPRCPFILDPSSVGNVPIPGKPDIMQMMSFPEQKWTVITTPRYPQYSDPRDRLQSFKFCLSSSPSTRIPQLAAAGFFYSATEDCVVCFYCGARLEGWRSNDNPLSAHAQLIPACRFVRNMDKEARTVLEGGDCHDTGLRNGQGCRTLTKPWIVQSACEIFQKSLVEEVVQRHEQEIGVGFESADELRQAILQHLHAKQPITETVEDKT